MNDLEVEVIKHAYILSFVLCMIVKSDESTNLKISSPNEISCKFYLTLLC